MDKLKRGLSFRSRKKEPQPESSKPHQWQEDERKVREGTCSFQVRYLGYIEVFESRGMQVCEEAVKALKSRAHRSVWTRMSVRRKRKKDEPQAKGKYQRAILYVSGDALRVVDEISKGLIVDQTIEKVSFCAPDRNHEKGFAYICRDGTTRRWMCHGFLAIKESGERLSHAVGCAFAICLERKQKRDKETVSVQYDHRGTSFTRTGSFRQATLTERLQDPQSALVSEPLPSRCVDNPHAVERPKASNDMMIRQGSFRGFSKLNESSPFKRQVPGQMSLREGDLPSTLERQRELLRQQYNGNGAVPPAIPELSPSTEQAAGDQISDLASQVASGLSALSSNSPAVAKTAPLTVAGRPINADPIRHTNPWSASAGDAPPPATPPRRPSDAESWLNQTASSVTSSPAAATPRPAGAPRPPPVALPASPLAASTAGVTNGAHDPFARAPALRGPHHARSHSVDTGDLGVGNNNKSPARAPTLRELSQQVKLDRASFGAAQSRPHANGTAQWPPFEATQASMLPRPGQPKAAPAVATSPQSPPPAKQDGFDPFDVAWAAKGHQIAKTTSPRPASTNPFQTDTVTKSFEVKL